jgi:flagellar biosynthesis/type III secretory pathway M-ring protein FliF/YscJ
MVNFCIDIPDMIEIPSVGPVEWYYVAGGAGLLLLVLFLIIFLLLRRRKKKPAPVEEKGEEFLVTEEHKQEAEKFNVVEQPDTVEGKLQDYEQTDDVFSEAPAKDV